LDEATVLRESAPGAPPAVEAVQARTAEYRAGPNEVWLSALFDAVERRTHIVRARRGQRSFYVISQGRMTSVLVSSGSVHLQDEVFAAPLDVAATIARLTDEVDDRRLSALAGPSAEVRVDIGRDVPWSFWTEGSGGSSQLGIPTLVAFSFSDGLLRLDLLSDGEVWEGSFWIDWAKRTLLRSTYRRR
jgi:hypothetical protein